MYHYNIHWKTEHTWRINKLYMYDSWFMYTQLFLYLTLSRQILTVIIWLLENSSDTHKEICKTSNILLLKFNLPTLIQYRQSAGNKSVYFICEWIHMLVRQSNVSQITIQSWPQKIPIGPNSDYSGGQF